MGDERRIPIRNPDGYPDPTAHKALTNVTNQENAMADYAARKLNEAIRIMIDLAGFDVEYSATIVDRRTKRKYRLGR